MSNYEAELAAHVVEYLEDEGYEVFKEVTCPNDQFICDIYAARRNDNWAIEVKTSCSLSVMEQAENWKLHAHRSSIAVPLPQNDRAKRFASRICDFLGIGLIEIKDDGEINKVVQAHRRPGCMPPPLSEEMKASVAGTDSGQRWTRFDETCKRIRHYAQENPGKELRQVIDNIDHHYKNKRSAHSSLRKAILDGVVDGVKPSRRGNRIHVLPHNMNKA